VCHFFVWKEICVFVCVCPKSSHDLCVCLCLSQVKAWSVCLFVSHLISQSSCLKKNIVNHLLSCVKIKEKFTIKNKKSNDLTISMRNFDKIQKKFVLLLYLQKTFNIMQIIFWRMPNMTIIYIYICIYIYLII
jgi:hypothetical protein